MSGHSKWSNIKHKKEKTDAQKAKVFTKIGKEIAIAVKESGGDPATNSKLRDLIQKAKANNVPNDNIDRTIKKALGASDVAYEEITYEGYGPSGVAVIVETTTDNRNRTAGNVRALEAGAEDFKADDGVYVIYTEPDDVYEISDALKAAGYEVESADKEKVADSTVDLDDEEDRKFMGLLIEKLEDDDDVMNVYHNWGNCDEE